MAEQQAQQNDQGQHSSILDRGNNAIRKGRSAYKNIRNLKRGVQAIRTVSSGVAALAGGGEVVIIVIIIIFVIILLIATIMTVFGGGSSNGGQICHTETVSSGESTATGNPPTMSEFLNDFVVLSCPLSTWGSNSGCTHLSGSDNRTKWIYSVLKVPLSSPKYTKLLTGDGKIYVRFYPKPKYCGSAPVASNGTCGGASGGNALDLGGYYEVRSLLRTKVSVVHETGHLIGQRNGSLRIGGSNAMPIKSLSNQDPKCYMNTSDGTYIATYANKTNNTGGGWYSETFAETVGMNAMVGPGITYSKGISCTSSNPVNCSRPITNYPTTCNNTYDWIKDNVYGGVDFFASGGPSEAKTITICVDPTPAPVSAPITGASEFDNLVRGQGRNVSALGSSASTFVNNVLKNIGSRNWNNATNKSYLTQIYNTALSKRVNPVMLLVIWGVEASWRANGTEFGCISQRGSGFSSQLSCGTNILNNWMNYFVSHQKNGVYQYTKNCAYTDMFSFAYEKYTPVCALDDSNDASRKNFVTFYKIIMGL